MVSLADKKNGFLGTVARLVGDKVLVERLAELGIIPGSEVSITGLIAFGDPLLVEVRETRIALRKSEAYCVLF